MGTTIRDDTSWPNEELSASIPFRGVNKLNVISGMHSNKMSLNTKKGKHSVLIAMYKLASTQQYAALHKMPDKPS
jgi:hypothetical protein